MARACTGTLSIVQGTTTLTSIDITANSPNSSGYYSLTIPAGVALGSNSLKVVYSGDTNYSSNNYTFFVTGVTSVSTSVSLSYGTPLAYQAWTISAAINGTLLTGIPRTGTLTATLNGNTLASINLATSTPNSGGFYALSVPGGLPVGTDAVVVTYSGDSNYTSSSSTATLNLVDDSLSVSYSGIQVLTGVNYTVSAAINGALVNGNAPRTGTLSLVDGTTTLASVNVATTTPSSSGYYALTVPGGLSDGTHSLKVVYTGDSNYTRIDVHVADDHGCQQYVGAELQLLRSHRCGLQSDSRH